MMDSREYFNFNIIADGNLPQLQYFGYANQWSFRNIATETSFKTLSYEQIPSRVPQISWGKYCTETREELLAAYELFSAEVKRQKEEQRDLNPNMFEIYPDCLAELKHAMKVKNRISISQVRAGKWASCTVKIVLKYIARENLEIIDPRQTCAQDVTMKPCFIADTSITAEELLDLPLPAISLAHNNHEIHLVFVSGCLKVLKRYSPKLYYKTSMSHGDNLYSRVYPVVNQAEKDIDRTIMISLKEAIINLKGNRVYVGK
ncbi:unnamed protein product [Blumeria hordei]|uniref:Uncharacterized protein n=1 Tax=Blumeria hordei TaxID=2867405 RepID=A0A383UHR5_BLUHO|nr:unnamed protein product [Blumeria hordei]